MKKYYLILIIILLSANICYGKQQMVKCDAEIVNLRSEPNIHSKIIDIIRAGDIVPVIEKSRESVVIDSVKAKWYKIQTKNGKTGWVFSGYLSSVDGKTIPFGVKSIIGEWLIDDNCGDGRVKFSFLKNGVLIIKGENSNAFDAECKWIYHADEDNIEVIFNDKELWQERLRVLKRDYSIKNDYLSIDESRLSLLIKISRYYYNEKEKIFEYISFPFYGYFVSKYYRRSSF